MAEKVIVKWMRIHAEAVIPDYVYDGDAGFDLAIVEDVTLKPFEKKAVRTGLKVELPRGYEMQIRPRSGISLRMPLLIANTPGTIDSNYRGEIKIILWNISTDTIILQSGMRIAQGVIAVLPEVKHVEVEELTETKRNQKGFGSTGVV